MNGPVGEITRHGAYLCLGELRPAEANRLARQAGELVERLELRNEFDGAARPTDNAVAFVRRLDVSLGHEADAALSGAQAIVHVASPHAATVEAFRTGLEHLLTGAARITTLAGVVRPARYTGAAMHQFAYAHQLPQQPGHAAPHAFFIPLRKSAEWWRKDWMERHTYILPRYDDDGRMRSKGHALSAEAGVAALMRRTWRHEREPAPDGAYDFLNWFECAEKDVKTFHAVCAALRNAEQNPEWRFVREGPTWHGRRVQTWEELFG
jgi:hypothetical protein